MKASYWSGAEKRSLAVLGRAAKSGAVWKSRVVCAVVIFVDTGPPPPLRLL